MSIALTELGPFGVPISIKLQLFTNGFPLRSILAVGLVSRYCDSIEGLAMLDLEINEVSTIDEQTGEIILLIESDGIQVFYSPEDGSINLLDLVESN